MRLISLFVLVITITITITVMLAHRIIPSPNIATTPLVGVLLNTPSVAILTIYGTATNY